MSIKGIMRKLRRNGAPDIRVKNPLKYLHAHKRRMVQLRMAMDAKPWKVGPLGRIWK